MKVTWLGQAGLLFETDGKKIIVDPYLSNSVQKIEPHNARRVAVDERFLSVQPDILLLTHNHLDHTDPETLCHYLSADSEVLVLASAGAWENVRKAFGGVKNNYVKFACGTEWTQDGVRFIGVHAEHSGDTAIGFVIEAEGKRYYVTGDTLYNGNIFQTLPEKIDYVFLPVNGRGNNMNMADGARFCEKLGAVAIPLHCGLFDSLDMQNFPYEKKIVPQFYQEIKLD